jgi:hypothetical protein
MIRFESAFAQHDSSASSAQIILSFRSESLQGKVRGVITRASSEAYRIELASRGELFLKAYVTQSMTIIWPEGGAPLALEDGVDVMLSEVVSGLPEWPLRCCMPLMFPDSTARNDSFKRDDTPRLAELDLCAQANKPLVARFSDKSVSRNFPYRKIVIEEPGRYDRLVWRIKP